MTKLLGRLVLISALLLLAYGAWQEPDHARAITRTLSTRLQSLLPVAAQGEGDQVLEEGYRLLQENSMVGLYGARKLFAHAVMANEGDVAARSGLADAEVALSFAYDVSAELMGRYIKTLRGPQRRAAERLMKEERRQGQDHLKEGQQLAKEALRLNPAAFVAQRAMASAVLQAGRNERARPYLSQAGIARPQDLGVRLLLAQRKGQKEPSLAVVLYQQLLLCEPQHNGARLRLALLFAQLGERAKAREQALMVLAGSPGHALAQRLLMELEPLGAPGPQMARLMPLPTEENVAALLPEVSPVQKAADAQLHPISPSQLFSLHTAKTVLTWAMRLADASYRLAEASLRALYGAGTATLQPLLATPPPPKALQPADADAEKKSFTTLLQLKAEAKRLDESHARGEAELAWQRVLAFDSNCVEALIALGWCRLAAHDPQKAIEHFSRAQTLATRPEAEVLFGLGESYRMDHKTKQAIQHYQDYLKLRPNGPLAPVCHQMLEELAHQG